MPSRLTIDGASQRTQKAGILARLRAAAPAVVKAAGFELAQVAVDRISGIGSIRRVDTTRYRGSIAEAAQDATGRAPQRAPRDKVQAGDAAGSVTRWNTGASLRMVTFVPYAAHLEWGTVSMRAGYHLSNAKMQARPTALPAAAKALSDALRGA